MAAAAPTAPAAAPWPAPPMPPPPSGWISAEPVARYTEDEARRDGRLLGRKAAVLVAIAIGLGGVLQIVAVELSHRRSIEPDALIRYDLVLTLGLYAVVAAMIVSQITPSVRLRWGDGPLWLRIGIGAGAGVGFSLVLLALISAASGHLQTDPRIVLLMSEGDPTHIAVTVFIGCLAAPLVEETLFRGLLLESLRPRGKALAIFLSAAAFAVWHLMPASLIYYAALGAALGGLYVKRGLACSIAAHVGFNGVLTVAAIMIVLGPSHPIQFGGLTMTAPSGWSVDTSPAVALSGADVVLVGPSDAELEVVPGPAVDGVSAQIVAQRLADSRLQLQPGLVVDASTVRLLPVPVGQVVEVSMTAQGRAATLGLLVTQDQSYELVFLGAGSVKAENDFNHMLSSLRTD